MRKQLGFGWLCCLAAIAVSGCGDSSGRSDAGPDAIVIPDDAGRDAPGDDAGDDGGVDAGDGGGSTGCNIGTRCDPARGCEVGECLAERSSTIGGDDDPIEGHPDGDTSLPTTFWQDGYCVPRLPTAEMTMTCDPDDPEDTTCGDCGTCVDVGGEPAQTLCFANCTPSATDNASCRDGYACELSLEVCFPGCNTDDECRVYRADTNENGEIDAYDPMDNPDGDHLVYDTDSDATCNTETYRCDQSGTAGAQAGDNCTKNSECEENGRCLSEEAYDWPGGYCTKFRCDLEGRDCAGDAVCQERRVGVALCLQGCTVADNGFTEGDYATYTAQNSGCPDGYACNYNGTDGAGVPDNGACLPGEFNDIEAPNTGGTCEDPDGEDGPLTATEQCYSAFGLGLCLTGAAFPNGYCTMLDCGAPGIPSDVCGADAQCLDYPVADSDLTWCLQNCDTADDCTEGMGCLDYDGDETTSKVCFPGCLSDEDCRSTETCDIPAGEMSGECVAA